MSYQPQPGTIPYRAIRHLQALPAGTQLSTADLAEVLGVEPSGIVPTMTPALRDGWVERFPFTTTAGRASFKWVAGRGIPLPAEEDDDPPVRRYTTQASRVRGRFNATRWHDGSLILTGIRVRDDGVAILNPEQVTRLRQAVAA